MTAASADLVVVGAGIVGLGAALAAVDRGLSVIVVERRAAQVGASVRNFGHLCTTAQSGEAREHALAARERWLRLRTDAGLWLRESGTVVVARHPDELALLEALADARRDRIMGSRPEVELLTPAEVLAAAPVAAPGVVGGALLPYDLQADPRSAVADLAAHLATRGVDIRWRTAVHGIEPGRVRTSRGDLDAGLVVVATNHDLDELLPDVAAAAAVDRCTLDMLRVEAPLRAPLTAPLLTGWSLVRYRAFAELADADAVRARLHAEDPVLAAFDVNHMHTQLPDGTLVVGDTHARAAAASPFQPEAASEAMLRVTRELFGVDELRVVERWQGVYASGRDETLHVEPEPGVVALAATTGIGMTVGLGLAEHAIAARLGAVT